jgi:methanogenic corrinoid protein MtbC1
MRLAKFVRGCQKMITQYYEDPDYYEEKLNQGMEQLGFKVIDGKIFVAVDEEGNIVPTKTLEENKNA